MSKLIAIVYPEMDTAKEAFETLKRLQKEYIVELEDAAYITKDQKNKVKMHQTMSTTGAGAAGGAMWGALFGLLFLAPIAGAVIGAGMGALAGKATDYGIDDKFIKALSKEMKAGSSAVFALGESQAPDRLRDALGKYGGQIISSSLPKEAQERIQRDLDKGSQTRAHAGV